MISAKTSSAVRRLVAEHGALEKSVESAGSQLERHKLEIARLESESSEVMSVTDLQDLEGALSAAQSEHGLLVRIDELTDQRATLAAQCQRLRAEWGPVKSWQQVAPMLPSKASARALCQGARHAKIQLEEGTAELARTSEERARLADRLAQEERGDLPSVERLEGARLKRDEALSELERAAEEGKPA
jgi:hypothetical protein